MDERVDWSTMTGKTGFFVFLVFGFSLFFSKGSMNICLGVLMLLSLVELVWFKRYKSFFNNPYVIAFLAPLAIGFVLSFFSTAGIKGPVFFLSRYRFFFLIVPFSLFVTERKHLNRLFFIIVLSGCLSLVYGFVNGYIIHSDISFKGKHIIGRSSDLLACLSMLVTVVVFQSNRSELKEKKYLTLLMVATLVLATSALMFIGQRGAMLGLFIGWMVYGVFFNRKFLVLIAGLLCAGFLIAEPNDYVMIRIKSILDENQKGNAIRLDLYNSAVPYLVTRHFFSGTGSKNDGQDYLDFFEKQDPAFQEDNARALKHPGNFHNSYMQMAAEGGILFFISFLAGMIYIHHAMITGLKNTELRLQCMAGLVTSAGAAVIFFFHGEFYRYGGIIYYLTLISSVWGYREGFPCRCGGGSDGR